MLRATLLVLTGLGLCGCDQSPPSSGSGQPVIIGGSAVNNVEFNADQLPTVTFDVPKMHCEVMCVPKVRETLARQVGVMDIAVDLDNKTATVAVNEDIFDADSAVDALIQAEFAETSVQAAATGE